LDTSRHIMCFRCGIDDLIDSLHGEIKCHELALEMLRQP
jgi:hypothetical protein